MNRKQIIVISVLGITALMLGCKPKPTPAEPRTISQEDVIGTYEHNSCLGTYKHIFLENGIHEGYESSERINRTKWSISNGELHVVLDSGSINVYRINTDKSITIIAYIDKDGKREDALKYNQFTFIKIK